MFSFRQKIILSYLLLFLVFFTLLIPFATDTVKRISFQSMETRANGLITKLQQANNVEDMVRQLSAQKHQIFLRVTLLDSNQHVLYDTHTRRLLGPNFREGYITRHSEVNEALMKNVGYKEGYSQLLGQSFAYLAKSFDFHGKTFVLRTAFPLQYVNELTHDLKMGFLYLGTVVLLLFATITWAIMFRLSKPIQEIIDAIQPVPAGLEDHVPKLQLRELADRNDEFGTLASTLNNLTERIQSQINTLTFERNEKEAVLEALVEGVIAVDHQYTITYANDMALQFLGLDRFALLGRHASAMVYPQLHDILVKAQKSNEVCHSNLQIEQTGSKLYLDLVAAPTEQGRGIVLVMQDQSTHYRVLEMRKDFIANSSHEMKTPLTIIRGFAEALSDNPGLSQEQVEGITERIMSNCDRMTSLIMNLLRLADIENLPRSKLNPCNLETIIDNCKHTTLSVYPDAAISVVITGEGKPTLTGDAELLYLALFNLVNNAAKYSPHDRRIHIEIHCAAEEHTIRIKDHGLGIPEDDLKNIFQRFFRVDKVRSTKLGGSGLGLSIVETIIDKHLGNIKVESTIDVGSTFIVTLPTNLQDLLTAGEESS